MSFERPAALGLLLLIPLLLWVVSQRRKARRYQVTAWILWERAAQRLSALPPTRRFQWKALRHGILLALVLIAAAGPFLSGSGGEETLVILDRSASMARRGPGGLSRLERARARLETIPGPLRVVGVPSPPSPSLLWSAAALDGDPRDFANQASALGLAAGSAWVISDDEAAIPTGFGAILLGEKPAPNAQILAAEIGADGRRFARISGGLGMRLHWSIETQGSPNAGSDWAVDRIDGDPWRLDAPGAPPESGALIRVWIEGPVDANPLDNQAFLVADTRGMTVAMPSIGQDLLRRAFLANPVVRLLRGDGEALLRVGPGPVQGGGWRLHLVGQKSLPVKLSGSVTPGSPVVCSGALEGFPLGDMPLSRIWVPEQLPEGAEVLLHTAEHPVLIRWGRQLALFVDPEAEPEWTASPSFPKLIAGLCALVADPRPLGWRGDPAGSARVFSAIPGQRAQLLLPGGEEIELRADDGGKLTVVLDQPGFHRLSVGSAVDWMGCWGPQGRGGPLAPVGGFKLIPASRGSGGAARMGRDLSPYLAGLALLLLVALEAPWRSRARSR